MIPDKEIYFDNKADFGAAAAKVRFVRQAEHEGQRFGWPEKKKGPAMGPFGYFWFWSSAGGAALGSSLPTPLNTALNGRAHRKPSTT